MVLDNRAADRKAQAHAVGFRRVKRLKDRLQLLFLNANSVIFYLDPDASRFRTGSRLLTLLVDRPRRPTRRPRYGKKVEEHLLELNRIALHSGKSLGQVCPEQDMIFY